jgi:hypothetical protein
MQTIVFIQNERECRMACPRAGIGKQPSCNGLASEGECERNLDARPTAVERPLDARH